jgi:hypothetical protein
MRINPTTMNKQFYERIQMIILICQGCEMKNRSLTILFPEQRFIFPFFDAATTEIDSVTLWDERSTVSLLTSLKSNTPQDFFSVRDQMAWSPIDFIIGDHSLVHKPFL